jgi:hypothetical protein
MKQLSAGALAVLAVATAAQAGTITNIGGTYGLTAAYIGTTTAVGNVNYNPYLFQSATGSPAITEPTATSTTPLQVTDTTNNPNSADGPLTFSMIGGNAAGTKNMWFSTDTLGSSSIYVPIDIYGVQTVWTMLNDYLGSAVTIKFSFNSTDSLTGATTVSLNLTDGLNIRSAVLCGTPGVSPGCPASASTGSLVGSAGSFVATTTVGTLSGPAGNQLRVSTGSINYPNSSGATNTVWNPSYSNIPTVTGGTSNSDAGSTGTLTLDDQAFQFGSTFSSAWLVGLTITEGNTGPGTTSMAHFGLSAVTVDSVGSATPEPSTAALGFVGLALAGFGMTRLRRKV